MDEPVTLITGTRRGIGRFLAEHYLARGHRVVGCSRQPCELRDPRYRHFELDVADEAAAQAMFSVIRHTYGRLDHLVCNAGTAAMNHSLLTPLSSLRRILDTNLTGTFLFAREAAKLMQRARFGRVVTFSTVAVEWSLEGESAYVASKAGVEALTRVMARELADFGITMNVVAPTPIETDLIRNVPAEKLERLVNRQAIRRYGKPEDVANVVDFFLQPASSFITGQVLYLGGV